MANRKTTGAKAVALQRRPRKTARRVTRAQPTLARNSLYAVHPGVEMLEKWTAELATKTGRSLDQWLKHIKQSGPKTEKECRVWLTDQYQLGTNSAWWLVEKAFGDPASVTDATRAGYLTLAPVYVERMYAGAKAALKPIFDELVKLARQLGDDVRICPCKTTVPLFRRHVFAQIKPATQKRIDLGLALGEEPFTSRLSDTGGRAKKDRITHTVALTSIGDIDLQVKRWIKQAYERDA
jgi:uncharacterized protein DUF5655/uncharacterized protein DUF4287